MSSSKSPEEPREPQTPAAADAETSAEDEALRAAEALKDQIAAVRDRIRQARSTLLEQARRERESRTFKE